MARKILLADDSVTAQNMGRKILADAGYEVITVNNGSAALKRIAELKPDLIVLDVYMPGYSGLEVCQRLKEAGETARIPVLLTVGKLEPFKPEEAKRARADGFIVKPFEASELLSALAKLEDKIVPRSESSKPGRFARSIAAIEEGRYDKSMAVEEDSGWKSRINFPSAKKKSAEKDDGDDGAIYNAVNKDLRTVVEAPSARSQQETKAQEAKAQEAKTEDARVDVGALAAQGLPKDVTPEEIAALAAAAAQVQNSVAAAKSAETVAERASTTPPRAVQEEAKPAAPAETRAAAEQGAASPASGASAQAETAAKAETAEQKAEEKIEARETKAGELAEELPHREQAGQPVVAETSAGSAAVQHDAPSRADEPVTMAMAMAAGSGVATTNSRWTAVAVALAPEDAAVSLEKEMQKAFAAFAAADGAYKGFAAAEVPEPAAVAVAEPSASAGFSEAASAKETALEIAAPASAIAAPEVTPPEVTPTQVSETQVSETLEAVAGAAKDAISAAIQELETAAASYVAQAAASASELAPGQAAHLPAASTTSSSSVEAGSADRQVSEAAAEERHPSIAAEELGAKRGLEDDSQFERGKKSEESQPAAVHPVVEELHPADAPTAELATAQIAAAIVAPEPEQHVAASDSAAGNVSQEQASLEQVSSEQVSAEQTSADAALSKEASSDGISRDPADRERVETAAPAQPAHGGLGEMAKKESEIAATTAAAWANWRRIRESDDPKAPQTGAPQDSAAMAVAAGAEHNPEELPAASDSDPDGIANIVDSVLADLRPKIVEEISRKLGKKK
ncbi:MAG TPA: response regulator [Terriglobales bacterium]|nr:response regulator [Terriglobales bacterium]